MGSFHVQVGTGLMGGGAGSQAWRVQVCRWGCRSGCPRRGQVGRVGKAAAGRDVAGNEAAAGRSSKMSVEPAIAGLGFWAESGEGGDGVGPWLECGHSWEWREAKGEART